MTKVAKNSAFLFLFDLKNLKLLKLCELLNNYSIFVINYFKNKNFFSIYVSKFYINIFVYILKKLDIKFKFFFFKNKVLTWDFFYKNFINFNFFKKFYIMRVYKKIFFKKLSSFFFMFFFALKYLTVLSKCIFLKKLKKC